MPPKKRKQSLTLIAEMCDLSKMTVSRALRNEPNVSPATIALVLTTAEKIGFIPRGRSSGKRPVPHNYYILFQQAYSEKDAFFSEIIMGIQNSLFEHGFGCSLGTVGNEYGEFLNLTKLLRTTGAKGIFVIGDVPVEFIRILQADSYNVIFIDYPGDPSLELPYNAVCAENVHGAHLAVNHLLKLGRRRVLLICGRKGHYFTNDLLRAYRDTLSNRGVEIDPRLIVYSDFHVNGGYEAVRQVVDAGISFDAVFSNDEMACGALRALREAGMNVPRDVSVVGFDGLPMSAAVTPALTTVEIDRRGMSRLGVKRLLAMEDESWEEEKFEKVTIFPKLVVRESCGASPPSEKGPP